MRPVSGFTREDSSKLKGEGHAERRAGAAEKEDVAEVNTKMGG